MYKVNAYKYGTTYRAESFSGSCVALCQPSAVAAAKTIARSLEKPTRHCIVISTGTGLFVEYVDFLKYNGQSIFLWGI